MNGRDASRLGRARAREAVRAVMASVDPEPRKRRSTRATGQNPRARRESPRQTGTNPSAGAAADIARAERMERQARARYYTRTGERWCLHCDDTGWIQAADADHVEACADHREMTTADAWFVLHPEDD